jgi:hypothetical protein
MGKTKGPINTKRAKGLDWDMIFQFFLESFPSRSNVSMSRRKPWQVFGFWHKLTLRTTPPSTQANAPYASQ